jgi:DNA-binding response OmpR family regulator
MSHQRVQNGTVLLLEDEALIAVALQADLEDAGYGVAGPFVTCASALDWLAGSRPDRAVLDTVLKDGPCKEVALKLTSLRVPFLVYSGHAENVNTLPELANATWVEKPATAETILHALAGLATKASATS